MNVDDDDDSANDSDYNPEKDVNVGSDDEQPLAGTATALSDIPPRRKRKALELWEEMKEEDARSVKERMKKVYRCSDKAIDQPMTTRKRTAVKLKRMIASIFGRKMKSAAKPSEILDEESGKSGLKEIALLAALNAKKKTTVTEVRKFAGQKIEVERRVSIEEQTRIKNQSASSSSSSASSLDKVLDSLKGPKVLSTVSKSSMDWENFKEKEGLEDALATATKDGYLTRKEFLDRCDYRAFEKERDERVMSSSSGSSSSSLI